jgi:hypothetical protein
VAGYHPVPASLKEALRASPLAGAGTNYRAYARWAERMEGAETAGRASVEIALRFKDEAKDSPFYERDLADYGRNYLHQYVYLRYGELLGLIGKAKEAAKAERYSNQDRDQNLARLAKLEAGILRAHKALTRLVATRRDMSLDDAILEATKTPGANRNLAQAIREHQSPLFAEGLVLVDSAEYLDQLKSRQHRFVLDHAKQELTNPSNKPVLAWREIFPHSAGEYIEKSTPVPYEQKAEKALPSQILQEFLQTAE